MIIKIIEATHSISGPGNWGKFMLQRYSSEEFARKSVIDGHGLLRTIGDHVKALWVLDLQTGEGARFYPPGSAKYDLDKHKVWVCPLFEPFLDWLYKQDLTDITKLPDVVELPDAPSALYGYRREGAGGE